MFLPRVVPAAAAETGSGWRVPEMSPSAAGKRQTFVKCTFLPINIQRWSNRGKQPNTCSLCGVFYWTYLGAKRAEFDYGEERRLGESRPASMQISPLHLWDKLVHIIYFTPTYLHSRWKTIRWKFTEGTVAATLGGLTSGRKSRNFQVSSAEDSQRNFHSSRIALQITKVQQHYKGT